jgi:4-amino-4-deoxy-L-arabinose transferase-like glycosyltransferase
LFLLALLPRLYVAVAWAREPVWDGHYYDYGARRIAAGLGYSDDLFVGAHAVWHPWCHYPVGYSALLGAVYRVFGAGPHVATITNAVLGACLAAAVHRLARYGLSSARARIAGLLVALSPGLILYSALLMTEPIAALGIVVAAWLAVRERDRRPLWGAVLAGLAIGLTTLVRPQSVVCAPAIAWLMIEPGASWRRTEALLQAAKTAAIASFVALAVVAPWTARNCRVMDGCAFVSTNAGWNLAIGAFPRATGRFETLRATDGCAVVTGQVQQDRCWFNAGVGWIRADPRRWIGLMPTKLGETFNHESFAMGYLGEADPAAWPEATRTRGRAWLTAIHRVLMIAAAFGFVARPFGLRGARLAAQLAALALVLGLTLIAIVSDADPFWLLPVATTLLAVVALPGAPERGGILGYAAFVIASVCVTHAVFFGEDRYHMLLTPLLCLLAAAAFRRSRTSPGSSERAA